MMQPTRRPQTINEMLEFRARADLLRPLFLDSGHPFAARGLDVDAMDILANEANSDSWIAPDCALIFGRRREII